MKRCKVIGLAVVVCLLFITVCFGESNLKNTDSDNLLKAMQIEIDRVKAGLKHPGFPSPYYISFRVQEKNSLTLSAKYGYIVRNELAVIPSRTATIQIRVGDYSFDNFTVPSSWDSIWTAAVEIPSNGSIDAYRTVFWLSSEEAYKKAVTNYYSKKSSLVAKLENEKTGDFTKEKPSVFIESIKETSFNREMWEDIVCSITGVLAAKKWVFEPKMEYKAENINYYFVDTDGAVQRFSKSFYMINISAWNKNKEGMKVFNRRNIYAADAGELPSKDKLLAEAQVFAKELKNLSEAEVFEPYSGPAILMPSVAGVFFHEALGHRLEGHRQKLDSSGGTFKGKVGEKILPDFLSLIDDPTLGVFQGKTLVGHYKYDDEGMPGKKVVLVENGILKNYLMSRFPIKGFDKSNGHGRGSTAFVIARQANLMVIANKQYTLQDLKLKLIEEAKKQNKKYGLIIKDGYSGSTETDISTKWSGNFQAFRATPIFVYTVDVNTGEEKLVYGAEIVGTPLVSLEKIIAAGDDIDVENGGCGAESGWVPISFVSPSILTTQIELQKVGSFPEKPFILSSPLE